MADIGNLGYTVNFDDSKLEEGLNKAILKAEELNNKLGSLTDIKMPTMTMADIPTTAIDSLISKLDEVVKKMEEVRTGGNKKSDSKSATDKENKSVRELIQNLNSLDSAYRRLQTKPVLSIDDANEIKAIAAAIEDTTEKLKAMGKTGTKALSSRDITKPIKDLIADTNALVTANQKYNQSLEKSQSSQNKNNERERLRAENEQVYALVKNLNLLENAYAKLNNKTALSKDDAIAVKSLQDAIKNVRNELTKYDTGLKALEKRDISKPVKDLISDVNLLTQANEKYNKELERSEKQRKKELEVAERLAKKEEERAAKERARLEEQQRISTNINKTSGVLGLSEESYVEATNKINAIKNRLAELSAYKATLQVDSNEFLIAQKQVQDLEKALYTLKGSLRSMKLEEILTIEPKSIREASQLIQELAARRDTLNKADKNYLPTIMALNRRQAELIAQNRQLATAGLQIEAAQKRTQQTVQKTNNEFKKQSLLATQLFNTLRGFAGFYFARDAVKQLAEIRGQFELQQVALRAIIQDAERADQLFNQIKSLAPISPFQFKDLVSYTKQLAAFQIPVDDLYDTMKRLADVSSGLGVDMGRLILAYGQIRSAGVLRGQELRQLTEAGIPALEMLRKKLEEVRGTSISLGEVFDAISSRQIPFEYIAEMFQGLTDEGGIFFEMQEKQASTLYGIMSNLKDNYQLMLNEIGEANDGFLKGSLNALVELMANWKSIRDVIEVIIAMLATFQATKFITAVYQFTKLSSILGSTTLAIDTMAEKGSLLGKVLQRMSGSSKTMFLSMGGGLSILVGVGVALYNAYKEANRFDDSIKSINSEGITSATNLVNRFNELYDKLRNAAKGSQNFRDAISDINKEYGKYLPNLLTEENALSTLKDSYDSVTSAIYRRTQAMAYEKSMQELAETYGKAEADAYQELISRMIDNKVPKEKIQELGHELKKTLQDIVSGEDITEDILGSASYNLAKLEKVRAKLLENKELTPLMTMEYGAPLNEYIKKLALLKKHTEEVEIANSATFGANAINMNNLNKRIEELNKTYAQLESEQRGAIQPVEDLKKALDDLNTQKMKDLLNLYREFGMQDKVNEITLKLNDKTLTGFRKDVNAVIKRIQEELNDSKLAIPLVATQDKDFDTYISDLRNRYKEINDKLKDRSKYDLANAQSMKNELYVITEIGKQLGIQLETQKKMQSEEDKRIQSIKEEFNTLKSAVEEYKNLAKVMSEEGATKTTQEKFGVTFGFDEKSINDQYNSIIKKLAALQSKGAQTLLSTVKLAQSKTQTDYISGAIKNSIKRAEDMIKNYKPKFNLYEKLLGLTNDTEFAIQFAFEGIAPNDIIENMKNMFQSISGVPFTLDMDLSQFSPAIQQLGGLLQKNLEDQRDTAIKNFAALLAEYQSYEDKRTSIMMEAQRNREAIQNNEQLTDSQKGKGLEAINTKERQDLAKNAFDQFKDTDMYRKAFEDLGNVAGTTLDYLIQKLEQFAKEAGKDLSVTDFKNLTSVIEDLKDQARENNPFDAFIDSIQQYKNSLEELMYAQQIYAAAQQTGVFAETVINEDTGEEETRIITLAEAHERLMQAQNRVSTSANNVKKASESLAAKFAKINTRIRGFGDTMERLGETMDSDFLKAVGEVINTVMDIGDAVGSAITDIGELVKSSADAMTGTASAAATAIATIEKASVILAIISAALKVAMAIANLFGKKNQKILEESRKHVENLQAAYSRLSKEMEYSLGDATFNNIGKQYSNLISQKTELQKQLATHGSKGGLDDDEYEDVKNQLADLEQQIQHFQEDVARDIYGIDFKGWADDIASSLVDAFSRGEDAAKAFEGTVADIMRTVVKNLIKVSIIEPAMKDVQDYLTRLYSKYTSKRGGGTGGDLSDFMNLSKEDIAGMFSELEKLKETFKDSQILWNYFNDIFGGLLTEAEDLEEEGLAQGIQGVTEDTAQLVAGLLQGMRAEMVIQTHYFEQIQQALIAGNSISTEQLSILTQHLAIATQIRDALQSVLTIAVDGSAFRVVLSAS